MNNKWNITKKYYFIILNICITILYFIYTKKNSVIVFLPSNEDLLALVFPTLLAIISSFTAISILAYQLIYNRYPLYPLRKKINNAIIEEFVLILVLTVFSLILWLFDLKNQLYRFAVLVLFLDSILSFMIFLIQYRKFDIHGNINELSKKIIYKLESKKTSTTEINELMINVKEYFKDSLSNKEHAFTESIIILYRNVLITYIKNLDIIKFNDKENQKITDKLNEELINSLLKNYKIIVEYETNKSTINSIENCVVSVCYNLIDFEKISLFKYCIKKIEKIFMYSISNDIFQISRSILKIFKSLHIESVTDPDKSVFEELIVTGTIDKIVKPMLFFNKDLTTVYESQINLSSIIVNRLNNKKSENIEEIIKVLFENTIFTITRDKENKHTDLWMNLYFLANEIMESKSDISINYLIDQVDRTIKVSLKEKIEDPIFHCAYIIKSIENKIEDDDCIKDIKKKKYLYTLLVLDSFPEAAFLFMPDYKKIIANSTNENICIDSKILELNEIFEKLIRIDRSPILYSFLDELNHIILTLKKENRINQEKIVNIYENILTDALILKSTENFKMILYKYKELVKELDEESKLSEKLTETLISVLDEVSRYLVNISSDNIAKHFLSFLTQIANKTNAITKKKEYKERIIQIIYSLSIEAIEAKNHNLIRICSNSLGWYAKDLYDSGDIDNFKNCIKYASKIYKLIDEMDFDVSLKIFIGTLFVILGSYLYGKNQHSLYSYLITLVSKLPDTELLAISKKIRENSFDTWDKNLDIDSKKSMNRFIQDLRKKVSA